MPGRTPPVCLALGDTLMRPFCPELIREAAPGGGRGGETPGGHGEPGRTTPHQSLNRSAYQSSVRDWLNTPIHLIGPADMRQLLIGSPCDLPATAVDSCLIGWL